jgi:hypothetical protein
MSLSKNALARIKSLAKRGDDSLSALSQQAAPQVKLTVSGETTNVITLTGQIVDAFGSPIAGARSVVVSVPFDGTPSTGLAVGTGGGTAIGGAASATLALTTTTGGKFIVEVTDAAVENIVVQVAADGCPVRVQKLVFAA